LAAKTSKLGFIIKNSFKYKNGYLNQTDNYGNTVLYYAVQSLNLPIIDYLIQKLEVNVDEKCELGNTPLHYAMMVGDKV